jgi:hypothetical protein
MLFFRYTPELIFPTFDEQASLVLNVARVLAALKVFVMCIGFTLPCFFQDSDAASREPVKAPRQSSSQLSTSSKPVLPSM